MKASEIKPGIKINMLTVVSFSHLNKRHRKYWNCLCDCGTEKKIHGSAMVSGNTKSCGCLAIKEKSNRRISKNHSEITAIILGYKRHALDRGYYWNLSREEVISVISKNCEYCGIEPSNIKKTKNSIGDGMRYSGIDRVDSSLGYFASNVVPACKICNFAKSNMDKNQFRDWALRIGEKAAQWGAA